MRLMCKRKEGWSTMILERLMQIGVRCNFNIGKS